MKLNIKQFIVAGAALLGLSACNDSYEELPIDQYTYEYLFSETDSAGTKAQGFIGSIYETLQNGHSRIGSEYLDAASDDALPVNMDNNPDVLKLQLGQYSASTRISSEMGWSNYYQAIRRANIFIEGVDRVPFNTTYVNSLGETQPLNKTLKAEARFLRAFFYFELIKRYGGVPLMIDKVYDINDNLELPRNTFEECVNFIVSELTEIQDDLRGVNSIDKGTYGHAPTKAACQALKARVLLYAASPLFNENPIEAGNELVGYKTYDKNRWKLAADAARELMEGDGHLGTGKINIAPKLRNPFMSFYHVMNNKEMLFWRQGSSASHSVETNCGPLGFSGGNQGGGHTNPTQNLVDAFPMKDGKAIGTSDKYPYDLQNPYANRDPRLDATILYNGRTWLNTTLQTWQGGSHNPIGSSYSKTGYYMCKFMNDCTTMANYTDHMQQWVILRYTELLLNFAEAENEWLDAPSSEIYDVLVMLRKRAGIEKGDDNLYGLKANMTKDEMRQVIRNERRIELAFEEHRFYDIRRWREAENIYQQPLKGMRIVQNASGTNYSVYDVQKVNFDKKRYLFPIPYSEVNKNDNMIQNPNWN